MTVGEQFAAELTREAATTRRVLERVPEPQLAWRPHQKSMTLGQLAYHVAVIPRRIADLVTELSAEPPRVPLPETTPVAEILAALDEGVPYAAAKLSAWSDEDMAATWRMLREGKTLLELPRGMMLRNVMLNHWYHHRGQLTVYLRLLDVPLPSVYGPSADAQMFGG
jgi:uncharacterized damage-inducible protein DinB